MNEAEYLVKNYGDRGGCWPRRITPSEISIILHMIQKPHSLIVNIKELLLIITQPVNGALTCKKTALLTSSVR